LLDQGRAREKERGKESRKRGNRGKIEGNRGKVGGREREKEGETVGKSLVFAKETSHPRYLLHTSHKKGCTLRQATSSVTGDFLVH